MSVAMIALISTGFMHMMAANTELLSRQFSMERSNYELSARAEQGGGIAEDETVTVRFELESGETVEERFRRYAVESDDENRITYYRHEQREGWRCP